MGYFTDGNRDKEIRAVEQVAAAPAQRLVVALAAVHATRQATRAVPQQRQTFPGPSATRGRLLAFTVRAGIAARTRGRSRRARLLRDLLDDDDVGVRKAALRTAGRLRAVPLRAKVEEIGRSDPEAALRRQASETLSQLSR